MSIFAREIGHEKEEKIGDFSYLYDYILCMLLLYVMTAKRLSGMSLYQVCIHFECHS